VRNLGVQLDPNLSLHQNITAICRCAFHRLAEIRKIRKMTWHEPSYKPR
jgi:hypothetical protein